MDKTVEYYQSLGIATTIKTQDAVDLRTYPNLKVYGKPIDAPLVLKEAQVQIGSLELHLIQPVEGESPIKEFLDNNGEGIQHIAFTVDDFEKEKAELIEKGSPVVLSGKEITGEDWALFDTRKVGNVIIELCGPPAK